MHLSTDDPTQDRYLILFADGVTDEGPRAIRNLAGLTMIRAVETGDVAAATVAVADSDGVWWEGLGVAALRADPDQLEALLRAVAEHGPIAVVERQRRVYAIAAPAPAAEPTETELTWGLQSVGVTDSEATGAGIRVAVLDTGFDVGHPDFAGRTMVTRSFVDGQDVRDGHGHGTHVIGTACGPRQPADGPGYGVAFESEIYVGKVLGDDGSGTDAGILAGIAWAVENRCAVVSMSLGAPAQPGEPHSATFERAAKRAMDQGTLIVAAAGNESRRSAGVIAPVGHPANCPTVLAVGAIDAEHAVADFSCGTVDPKGAVDVAAPGVDVHSSWPMPRGHHSISGTSMATPHVSGIAALTAQAGSHTAWELWARLCQTAIRLPWPSTDVGAGLVQAP